MAKSYHLLFIICPLMYDQGVIFMLKYIQKLIRDIKLLLANLKLIDQEYKKSKRLARRNLKFLLH
jgi:hypothetical protein